MEQWGSKPNRLLPRGIDELYVRKKINDRWHPIID